MKAISRIYESGEHLLELINDILDISKAESGRLELALEPVSIKEVVDAAIQLVTPQAMKKRLRITTSLDNNLDTFSADLRRLKQMLVNLLSNAVKFTRENGRVGIEVAREQDSESITFNVWDTGIGIPAGKIKRLFQPFVLIDGALSREFAGTAWAWRWCAAWPNCTAAVWVWKARRGPAAAFGSPCRCLRWLNVSISIHR